ncbi:Glutathione S-transferase [Taenia solium]|eukprot:TsM_000741700 transcript=TsM_000741700 gene=TsM_000741700
MAFGRTYYSPDSEKVKAEFFETLAQKLPQFEAYLGEKQWLTGEKINYPDFALCDLLMQMVGVEPTCLEKHPVLQAYVSRFKSLPELEDYLASK